MKRRRGRPAGRFFDVNISPRLSKELKEDFEALAKSKGMTASEFVREILEREVKAAQKTGVL